MSSTFNELGLPADLVAHLESLGVTTPSPIQAATMADLLAGRDVMAAAPTGSGKTIAFAAPLMARLGSGKPNRPVALVLAPTRELAAQIHSVMIGLGRVRRRFSGSVYGGVKQGPQVNNLRRGVDVLVACPGRLEDLIEQGHVRLDQVKYVVVDEADRMADMGFLPAVRRIIDQCAAERQTVLFSATLDRAADDLARTHLNDPVRHSVVAEAEDLSKATHLFWTTSTDDRAHMSAEIVRRAGRTMLFTRTRHGADRLVERMHDLGVRAAVIHGGRSQAQRDHSLAAFHRGQVAALVATDVAARGIHVDHVACVVHVDLPDNPTDYQHRSGRTARAGATGTVISLVTPQQRRHAKSVQRHFGFEAGAPIPDLERLSAERVLFDQAEAARPRTATGLARDDRGRDDRGRDDRGRDDRPRDDRPRSTGPRPGGPRAGGPGAPRTDRPRDDRPRDDRPRSDRNWSDRPRSDHPAADRPRTDRPRTDGGRQDRPQTESAYPTGSRRPGVVGTVPVRRRAAAGSV